MITVVVLLALALALRSYRRGHTYRRVQAVTERSQTLQAAVARRIYG